LADQGFEEIVSQTRQLRGRIYSERVEWNLAEIGRMVDCWQPVEVFNGTEFRVGSVGRVCGPGVRRDRVADKTATWPYLF
jgi:hypothetical protein